MKFCTKCGNQIDDAARFCNKCGAQQHVAPQPQYNAPRPQYSRPQPLYSALQSQNAVPQPQLVEEDCTTNYELEIHLHSEEELKDIPPVYVYLKKNEPSTVAILLSLLFVIAGWGCYIFSIIDFCGMFFGYDLTGVSWSPIVAVIAGYLVKNFIGPIFASLFPQSFPKERVEKGALKVVNRELCEPLKAIEMSLTDTGDDVFQGDVLITDGEINERHKIVVQCKENQIAFEIEI